MLTSVIAKPRLDVQTERTDGGKNRTAGQFSGMLDAVSSLDGVGQFIGRIYPATHFIDISRGVFNKGLHFADLSGALVSLAAAVPVILLLAIALLKKQER